MKEGEFRFLRSVDSDALTVERCGVRLGPLLRLRRVELVRERELRLALALEGCTPAAPHRKRTAEHRPLPALLAQQHGVPKRASHATPFSTGNGQLLTSASSLQREPASTSLATCFTCGELNLRLRFSSVQAPRTWARR